MSYNTNREWILENNTKIDDIITIAQNLPDSGEGQGPVKLFTSIEEMNSSSGNHDGDLALVYKEEIQPVTAESEFDSCTFPNEVVLSEAFSENFYGDFRAVDSSSYFYGSVMLSSTSFTFYIYSESMQLEIKYSSSDGITYTRTDGGDTKIDFGTLITYEIRYGEFNPLLGNFMKIKGNSFEGLFIYNEHYIDKNELVFPLLSSAEWTNNNATISTVSTEYFNIPKLKALYTKIQTDFSNSKRVWFYLNTNKELCFIEPVGSNTTGQMIFNENHQFIGVCDSMGSPSSYSGTVRTYKVTSLDNKTYTLLNSYTGINYYSNRYYIALTDISTLCASVNESNNMYFMTSMEKQNNAAGGDITITAKTNKEFSKFETAGNQFTLDSSDQLLDSIIAYGKDSIITGTLGNPSTDFDDKNAEVYTKIATTYDTLTPISITNENKTQLNKMKVLPVKADGTPLINISAVNSDFLFRSNPNIKAIFGLDMTGKTNMNYMFQGASNLEYVRLINTSLVTDMGQAFSGTAIKSVPVMDTSRVNYMNGTFCYSAVTNIPNLDTSNVTQMFEMFSSCNNLTTIPQFDTSNVTQMSTMFNGCVNLTSVPNLNTSKVTDMSAMFSGCTNLTSVPNFDTSNVTNLGNMFDGCKSLSALPNIDTSKTNRLAAFARSTNISSVPNYNTSRVNSFYYAFYGCKNLTEVPSFNVSNVTEIGNMFKDCINLVTIPVLNFTSKCNAMRDAFNNCPNLSDESLNNIMASLVKMTAMYSGYKTLAYAGLTQNQANRCKTLNNWSTFTSKGWSTGY